MLQNLCLLTFISLPGWAQSWGCPTISSASTAEISCSSSSRGIQHLATADLIWSWWWSCFKQDGVGDLLVSLQLAFLSFPCPAWSVVQNQPWHDGIIFENRQESGLRCPVNSFKRLAWSLRDPQIFTLIFICPWTLLCEQLWIWVSLLAPFQVPLIQIMKQR